MPFIEAKYGIRFIADFIILLTVAVPILLFYLLGKPFERGFYCNDDSIRYPYRDSTISTLVLYLVGTLLPLLMMLVLEWFRCRRGEVGRPVLVCGRAVPPYIWSLYTTIGVFLFGCACSQLLTDVAKYSIGRLRPHFIAICNPDWTQIDCSVPGAYIEPVCHPEDAFRLKEARLSFPSGHASFSAFTMVYLVLYLQARLRIRVRLVRPFLQFVCLLMAFYTSLSRISDYKHHWSDVLFGSALGSIVAIAVWSCVSDARVCCGVRGARALDRTEANSSWLPLTEVAPISGSARDLASYTAPALRHQDQHHQRPQVDHIRHENMDARFDGSYQYNSNFPHLQTLESRQPLPRQERRHPRQPHAQQQAMQVSRHLEQSLAKQKLNQPPAMRISGKLEQHDMVNAGRDGPGAIHDDVSPNRGWGPSSSNVIPTESGTTLTSVNGSLGISNAPVTNGRASGNIADTRCIGAVHI